VCLCDPFFVRFLQGNHPLLVGGNKLSVCAQSPTSMGHPLFNPSPRLLLALFQHLFLNPDFASQDDPSLYAVVFSTKNPKLRFSVPFAQHPPQSVSIPSFNWSFYGDGPCTFFSSPLDSYFQELSLSLYMGTSVFFDSPNPFFFLSPDLSNIFFNSIFFFLFFFFYLQFQREPQQGVFSKTRPPSDFFPTLI